MGEMVEFRSNGGTASGYLADGGGPGLIVIQEWWGLVPHIKDVADRFAAAGFTALAPDLYHGESSTEPDGAGKLMMALNLDQAGKENEFGKLAERHGLLKSAGSDYHGPAEGKRRVGACRLDAAGWERMVAAAQARRAESGRPPLDLSPR
jgi:hypothetical protein